ncbi:phage tail protein I [Amycolatopsis sp. NBC_01307]|uniref:phage tail protein I n=1 Tax=Amycolatopsis sp. NBC_01307 TaxID=2903561 RepID=UPI002E13A297|nr:phage tail protein I [Amycolatopsis sp. NBC_01307]
MRGMVPGIPNPHPLGGFLPAVYQEDEFAMAFTGGLDEVLAPVLSVLDCLHAYIDPMVAPADFVEWLAMWVGVDPEENWPAVRRRSVIASAVSLHSSRGTVSGLRDHLEIVTGGRVEVEDTGGVTWSRVPTGAIPAPRTHLRVEVFVDRPTSALRRSLDDVIAAAKPAHVPHTLEVTQDDRLS